MNLFFDQCIGSGVPKSLRLVGYRNIYYLESVFSHRISEGHIITDQEWLERVGNKSWLAITEETQRYWNALKNAQRSWNLE